MTELDSKIFALVSAIEQEEGLTDEKHIARRILERDPEIGQQFLTQEFAKRIGRERRRIAREARANNPL